LKKLLFLLPAAAIASLLVISSAAADYALFGDATIVAGGNPGNAAEIVSDATGAGFGGVDFPVEPTAWSDFDTLSTDFNVTDDDCGGGSPRFVLGVDTSGDDATDGYVVVHLGPSPSYTGCAAGWQSSGNLIGNEDAGRYDFSGVGGSPFTTYSGAPAAVMAGSVTEVFVVVDGFWHAGASGGDGEQTVLVDNVDVNGELHTFEPPTPETKNDCKNGGWQNVFRADGSPFKNQGDCIQYVNTGK
jgi:hypothetical protein